MSALSITLKYILCFYVFYLLHTKEFELGGAGPSDDLSNKASGAQTPHI
jgi:hypothetical protein